MHNPMLRNVAGGLSWQPEPVPLPKHRSCYKLTAHSSYKHMAYTPTLMKAVIFESWLSATTGPSRHSSSSGSPILMASARCFSRA